MTITDKYKKDLQAIRQNPELLGEYLFVEDTNSKHFERLRLNIAIYNDVQPVDYQLVKRLFTEEIEWRKSASDGGEVDNLYFSAFILTFFENPEIIWLLWESKNIDFDSDLGFEGEYLLAAGIERTYAYLNSSNHPYKEAVLAYIGKDVESCIYSEDDIKDWIDYRHTYFRSYRLPVTDKLYFLYAANEKALFLEIFPTWIASQTEWTYENLNLYKTYAQFSENINWQIDATILSLNESKDNFLKQLNQLTLGTLYVVNADYEMAYSVLVNLIKETDSVNMVRDCVEQLCRIVLNNNDPLAEVALLSYKTIKTEQEKYQRFSPMVNDLISEVDKRLRK